MSSELCEEDVVQIASPQIISAEALVSSLTCVSTVSAQRVAAASAAGDLGRRLLLAARAGDTPAVVDLMTKGAPFTTDWLGTSPLHLAAANGHVSTCAVLLRAGVTRDSRTKVERTPLHLAAHAGHAAVVTLLLDHGAIVDGRDMLRMTPLHWAAARGHAEAARVLVQRGADLRARCKFRHTPRALATRRGHADVALMLERAEADADAAALTEQMAEETKKAIQLALNGTTTTEKNESSKSTSQQDTSKQPKIDLKPEQQQQTPSGEAAAAQLLRKHGITLLPTDDGSTVLNAIQSGRTVVLSDAGKLMLKESEVPAEPAEGSAAGSAVGRSAGAGGAGSAGVVLRATPVRAPPRGVKVFSVNNRMLVPAPPAPPVGNKIPVKKVINPQDIQQMKFIQLSSETMPQVKNVTMKAKNKVRPGPVKIIMNKSNFTKLIANAKSTVTLSGPEIVAEAGAEPQPQQGTEGAAGTAEEAAEEVRRLRAQLSAANAALAAAAADLRAARERLAAYEPS